MKYCNTDREKASSRVSVSFRVHEALLRLVDNHAASLPLKTNGLEYTRSDLIRSALRLYLRKHTHVDD